MKKKSLTETHPELAKQWHPLLNGDLTPQDISHGSNKKVWWLCKYSHEWETTTNHRSWQNEGCSRYRKENQKKNKISK